MIKNGIGKLKPIDIFLIVSLGISILFVIGNALTGGELFDRLVMDSTFLFSDYFYHIAGSSDTANMYSFGDPYSFPPFAYLLYTILWSLVPYKDAESILNWRNYRDYDNSLVVFVIYNMICVVLLLYCLNQYFKENHAKYSVLLPAALIVSYPFMCTSIQRGNVCMLVSLLFTLIWIWIDDENRIKQELALLLIACVAGFKLYPAILGLILIKRKEWSRAIRLVLYGLLAVFAPFLFIGGMRGAKSLFHTLTGFATYIDPDRGNTICGIGKWLGLKLGMAEAVAESFGIGINYLFFLAMIVLFFLAKKKWQESLFLTSILVSFVPSNYEYTSVYYLVVLLLFMKKYDGSFRENPCKTNMYLLVHCIGFALIFSADFLMLYFRYGLIFGIFMTSYFIIGINGIAVLADLFRDRNSCKSIH